MKAPEVLILLCTVASLIGLSFAPSEVYATVDDFNILLGRPADHSITINVIPDLSGEISFKYGTAQGVYGTPMDAVPCTVNEPVEVVIDGLTSNTRYDYRLLYRAGSGDSWTTGSEHSFHTQRSQGDTFIFTIISDSHMNGGGGNVALYEQTLDNVSDDYPDFHFDLGDTFWMDGVTDIATANQRYLAQRQWMGTVSHSASIFVAPGNHENEEGWNFDDTPVSKALLSVNARKRYYPNPITDGFYSGNDDTLAAIGGDQLCEDYYAWTWGDALFIVIDPYHYTMNNPYVIAGGEDNDEGPASNDRWDWTLGKIQYDWLKQILEDSHAKFKFIFAHHMVGGSADFVRGGAAPAHMFEWGGYNIDEETWGFDTRRPGWGDLPIHQLMVKNNVSAFFYGHDHEYAFQMRDGVVYQLVPAPSMSGYGFNLYHEGDPYMIRVLPNSGHIRVTVSPSQVTVDYVRSYISGGTNREVAYTYTISCLKGDFTPSDGDVDGSDLAAYISNSTIMDLKDFAANFGRTDCLQ